MKNYLIKIFRHLIMPIVFISMFLLISCTKELTPVNKAVMLSVSSGTPIVIIKADDFGDTTAVWENFCNLIIAKNACASMGIIPANVKSPSSITEIKRLAKLTNFEFWDHGYDHSHFNYEPFATSQSVPADYDGDGKADPSIYTNDGRWLISFSKIGSGNWDATYYGYGNSSICRPVPADYDGDGKADLSILTNDGYWYIDYWSNGFGHWDIAYHFTDINASTCIPVPADYDGDGKTDMAVYTSDGMWKIDYAANGYGSWDATYYGYGNTSFCHPVPADYDGDGKADLSIKTNTGQWYIDYASNGFGRWDACYNGYGDVSAVPVPADYDGDGKADLSVFVRGTCGWLIDYASNGFGKWDTPYHHYSGIDGTNSNPVPADYNGDKNAECSVTTYDIYNVDITKEKIVWLISTSVKDWDIWALYPKTEFNGMPSDFQNNHINLAQNFFLQNLGLNHTFGAPFNSTDDKTNSVLKQYSDINVWLCYQIYEHQDINCVYWKDPKKVAINSTDYHIILDIDYDYGTTSGKAQDSIIEKNYQSDLTKPYILIQMHPTSDVDFNDLSKLLDFYNSKGFKFMTPIQYYKYLHQ